MSRNKISPLDALIKKSGFKKQYIANKLGITRQTLAHLCQGRFHLTIDEWLILVQLLSPSEIEQVQIEKWQKGIPAKLQRKNWIVEPIKEKRESKKDIKEELEKVKRELEEKTKLLEKYNQSSHS